jgi:L-ascorbate metabolism protein UlaG (beta-lactamase superfamily)
MKITLVRHATLVLETSVGRVLVDPMLCAAGTLPPVQGTPLPRPNPLVDLPIRAEDVVGDVALCVVTHLHGDHCDDTARELLPPDIPILTMPEHAAGLEELGFTRVTTSHVAFELTAGRHGTGELADAMGPVCGFVVDGVYVAGDTIWCEEVEAALDRHRPRVVIVNAGAAQFTGSPPIVMAADDVRRVRQATDARVVTVHLEAMNHCVETRAVYEAIDGVVVPRDGETLELQDAAS